MRSDSGSVLVEALVSAAVAALVLMAAYQVVGGSAARHQTIASRRYALMVARSELAAAGVTIPLTHGVSEGEVSGLVWRLEAHPCGSGHSSAGVLYCIDVSVRDTADGPVLARLATRRLSPAA